MEEDNQVTSHRGSQKKSSKLIGKEYDYGKKRKIVLKKL